MNEPEQPRLSALAMAKRSSDIVISFSAEDVRAIRPAWSGPEAEFFMTQHKKEFVHMLMEVGVALMVKLIEAHEVEARHDQ